MFSLSIPLVVDVHPAWCGQCELMQTTYRNLMNQIDDSDKRLEFVSVRKILFKKKKYLGEGEERKKNLKEKFILVGYGEG